ncbi:hypothetical protein KFK09_015759 [Dendrobium nobile]|uniref:DUF3598 domain-containing protein n=1 Tax=Dendrobium nobile TaxID=94219 RepID=A0A8T3BBF2_DENNO|nr:hypothetical protein KFK09_015759 [Dendrobium nobile]
MAGALIPSCTLLHSSHLLNFRARSRPSSAPPSTEPFISSRPEKFGFQLLSSRSGRQCFPSVAAAESTATSNILVGDDGSISIDALRRFFDLSSGKWNGSFYQFDGNGRMLQRVSTKLSVSTYGEDDLISLIQTLYIKQPPSSTMVSGYDSEPEWLEYKIKETNMLTVDKYQQIGFFPTEKAFSLRYQTAGMLETVLRAGVLGEDDIGEESPRNLKLPSRFPSVVCENCLYSLKEDMRIRAFHIMDPKGVADMLLIFLEQRDDAPSSISSCSLQDVPDRIIPFLGKWKGHSITKRSGVYGATIAEADTVAFLELDENGQVVQDITSTSTNGSTANIHWSGAVSGNIIKFDGGFQLTLLPGGVYMGFPCDIAKSVSQSQSFHLELCWIESPEKRQRLVRTYDMDGLAVSSTYFLETRVY